MKLFRTILIVIFAFAALPARAQQSAPNWTFNYVPTPAEWSFWFGKKVDFAGALPCIVTGCVFSGNIDVTGTSVPTISAGDTWIMGQIGGGLTLVNGSGVIYNITAGGLALQGQGSSNDIVLRNRTGVNVIQIPTGTTTANITGAIGSGGTGGGVNGQLNLLGSTSGSAVVGVNATGILSIGSNVPLQSINFTDAGNGVAFIIGNAGGTIADRLIVTPSLAAGTPGITASGSDTNIGINLAAKGSGAILISGTGGLGYQQGVGVGGAVTQLTSRTTGVTLNNPTGGITLFSAAGSTTATTFTVTDSSVSAVDVPHVVQKSGTNLYEIFVTAVAAGSFNITFLTTGGTATDAPVFNFYIEKGSAN